LIFLVFELLILEIHFWLGYKQMPSFDYVEPDLCENAMSPQRCFPDLDPFEIFASIEQIRTYGLSHPARIQAETSMFLRLAPIATFFARLRYGPNGYDAEQVVNYSICKFMLEYVCDADFQFQTIGHVVTIISEIAINERNEACRRLNRFRRSPRDLVGNPSQVESLEMGNCVCQVNSEDPAYICEQRDEIEHLVHLLQNELHQEILLMLLDDFTWPEIASSLGTDVKKVRLWIDHMRSILTTNNKQQTTRNKEQGIDSYQCSLAGSHEPKPKIISEFLDLGALADQVLASITLEGFRFSSSLLQELLALV